MNRTTKQHMEDLKMATARTPLYSYTIAILAAILLAFGCSSDNPVDSREETVNPNVESASKASVDIYQNVSSFQQVSTLMKGEDSLVELDMPGFGSPEEAIGLASKKQSASLTKLGLDKPVLRKSLADSTIWDITERDSIEGVTNRVKLVYDPDTGIARLFMVQFDFRDGHPLDYDSTEIVADINKTFLDDTDDLLISLANLKRYRSGQLISEERGGFEPDPYPRGTEPTGGVLTNHITYSSSSNITSTDARLEFHEGEGGSYTKTSDFADGTTLDESVTFNEDGTGTFAVTKRDGTQEVGTFDSADEDGSGSYSKTTTFPAGNDPVSISESGTFTINPSDSTISGTFEKELTYQDGRVVKEKATVNQTMVGNVRTTTINAEAEDGHGFITITETDHVDQISGEWTTAEEQFLVFTAQSYPDGSAYLEFKLYSNEVAFENGEGPIATGTIEFYPDGSANGTVTEGDTQYQVTVDSDGEETIVPKNS
jgi:hypothetical protein